MSDAAPVAKRPKLVGIDALRGVAALAVLLYHAARHVDAAYGAPRLLALFQSGHAGVDLFFVLSGFLILHVHGRDIGHARKLGHYASQRLTRVLPLYWIALALNVAMGLAGGHGLPGTGHLLNSVLLLPGWDEMVLGPAWSLQHEILFYLAFATLIVNRAAGISLFALWGIFIVIGLGGQWGALVPPQIIGVYNLEFFLGLGIAAVFERLRNGRLLLASGVALLFASALSESMGVLDGYGVAARLCYGISSALLIAGMAVLSLRRTVVLPRWLGALGSASYSIYLFQFVFMGVVVKLWTLAGLGRPELHIPMFLVMVASGIAGGLVMTRLVERPLLRWTRRGKARGGRQSAETAPAI